MDAAHGLSPLRGRPAGERPGRALPALPAPARPPGRPGVGRTRSASRPDGRRRSRRDPLRMRHRPAPRASSRPWTSRSGRSPACCSATARPTGRRPARACSEEMPASAGDAGRYQLHGEIARGGMGVVLKGRDVDLGRDVAVKVLLEQHRDSPEMVRRFVEEAQIAGQLQHPGIVPVYELGRLPDGRLYIAMKLIRGRTLAALLEGRADAAEDRPRFLAIFEQVCQTMAYAHACGVIHRDLKPSNVMVGSFGEVQVMDWGLAKVLDRGGVADEERSLRSQADAEPGPHAAHRLHGRRVAGRLGAGHPLVHGARAGPGPARHARRAGGRLRPRRDPLRDPHRPAALRGAERQRGLPQGGAGGPGRGPGPARRLRRRGRAGRAGEVLPGRGAEGPAAGRGRGRRRPDRPPGRRAGAAQGRRAGPGPGRVPRRRGAQAPPPGGRPGRVAARPGGPGRRRRALVDAPARGPGGGGDPGGDDGVARGVPAARPGPGGTRGRADPLGRGDPGGEAGRGGARPARGRARPAPRDPGPRRDGRPRTRPGGGRGRRTAARSRGSSRSTPTSPWISTTAGPIASMRRPSGTTGSTWTGSRRPTPAPASPRRRSRPRWWTRSTSGPSSGGWRIPGTPRGRAICPPSPRRPTPTPGGAGCAMRWTWRPRTGSGPAPPSRSWPPRRPRTPCTARASRGWPTPWGISGSKETATSLLRRAQRAHPDDFWINYDLARSLMGAGQPDEAVRFFSAAVAIRPRSELALRSLGEALRRPVGRTRPPGTPGPDDPCLRPSVGGPALAAPRTIDRERSREITPRACNVPGLSLDS